MYENSINDLSTKANVIFVAGCARSGTSILQRCLSTVKNPDYLWSENSLKVLYMRGDRLGENVVLKRTAKCWKTLHLIPEPVKVVYVVRHPSKVLTSRVRQRPGYYVTPERWLNEVQAFWRIIEERPQGKLAIVRYEDLMADPDRAQIAISETLDVEFDLPFSRYCERNYLDEKIDKYTGELRIWEPIDPQRSAKNRSRDEEILRMKELQPFLQPDLSRFCERFSYNI